MNNSPVETSNSTLSDFLKEFNIETNGTAIAVQGKIIPRSSWCDYKLEENDKITIIRATQGG